MRRDVFLAAILLGILLRLLFIWQAPFTNDEGAYLYDARVVTEGRLPAGDTIAKTPVSLLLFSSAVHVSGHSLLAARAVALTLNLLTLIPLFYAAKLISGPRAASLAVVIWSLGAGPIAMYSLGLSEAVAAFFALTSLACWLAVPNVNYQRASLPLILAFLTGLSFALAYASRKTSLAVGVTLFAIYLYSPPRRLKYLVLVAAGAQVVVVPWLLVLNEFYGLPGVLEAVGMGYGSIIGERLNGSAGSWGGGFLWAFEVVARVATPLVMLLFLSISSFGSQLALAGRATWITKKLWLISTILAAATASVLLYGKTTTTELLLAVCYALFAWVLWLATTTVPRLPIWPTLVASSWFLCLGGLYLLWPTFLPDYAADFFPAVTLFGAAVIAGLSRRTVLGHALITLLIISNVLSLMSAYNTSWLGTFNRAAVLEAAAMIRNTVPPDEEIFTAAVIVPYASGHRAMADLSHPYWYQYTFIDPTIRNVFLPPQQKIALLLEQDCVQWAVVEHLTRYAFLTPPNVAVANFERDWQLRQEFKNVTSFRPNTLKLYHKEQPRDHGCDP
ncbi:MAG: hypothetical protein WD972_02640 [Candidatus Andersenbacteria bacterium]